MPIHVFSKWPIPGFPSSRVWPGTQDPSGGANDSAIRVATMQVLATLEMTAQVDGLECSMKASFAQSLKKLGVG